MCYAIPGKVETIDNNIATVNYFGDYKKAINELDDLACGDYVYAQGGYVIRKIAAGEAEDILATWKEVFFELQDLDLRLSRIELDKQGVDKQLGLILDKIMEGKFLSRENYLYLLGLNEPAELDLLYKSANFLRQKYHQNACCVHGIIEISNYCRESCQYCGIGNSVQDLTRYRLSKDEIVGTALEAIEKYGFKALVLQSGEDPGYSITELCEVITEIKQRAAALIFVSFGDRSREDFRKLYAAGARGLLMRFETSNPRLYEKLHHGYTLDEQVKTLKYVSQLGYLIITGGLIGLPGQTAEDILSALYLTHELNATMFSFGPFIPHSQTPMFEARAPKEEEVLKALALSRFIDPQRANVVVTTGLETIGQDSRKKGLLAGANSVMINITPLNYRRLYSIYPNRAHENESIEKQIADTVTLLKSIGRAPTDLGTNI